MYFTKRVQIIGMVLLAAVTVQLPKAQADLDVVREVVIAPKNGRAGANIGPVNGSANIVMAKAEVDITIGSLPASADDPLDIAVRAVFIMKNASSKSLSLTVGFPISDSEYTAFELKRFNVKSNGSPRSVFNRITGYPRNIRHVYVSGPDEQDYRSLPDYAGANLTDDQEALHKVRARNLFGDEMIGNEKFHNLMVWKETFEAGQVSTIEVEYAIAVPLQKNRVKTKKVRGSYKGIWPQEANNMPEQFLESLPKGDSFYFFDYYLTSGASWKGTIGDEVVTLKADSSWKGHVLYRSFGPEVNAIEKPAEGKTYIFSLNQAEPTANLLFALKRP